MGEIEGETGIIVKNRHTMLMSKRNTKREKE